MNTKYVKERVDGILNKLIHGISKEFITDWENKQFHIIAYGIKAGIISDKINAKAFIAYAAENADKWKSDEDYLTVLFPGYQKAEKQFNHETEYQRTAFEKAKKKHEERAKQILDMLYFGKEKEVLKAIQDFEKTINE